MDHLADELVARWRDNVPDRSPRGFYPDPFAEAVGAWWHSLEIFLLDERIPSASEATSAIISAFEAAHEQVSPSAATGDVWLNDVLALRRAINACWESRRRTVSLLIKSIRCIEYKYPNTKIDDYNFTDSLYHAICNCLVVEIYEPAVVESQLAAGYRAVPNGAFSLFYILERNRRALILGDRWPRSMELLRVDDDTVKKYQRVINALFDTLYFLNAQVMGESEPDKNVQAFAALLRKLHRHGSRSIENKARFMGFQRMLDIHWRRLAHLASDDMAVHVQPVIDFVWMMALEDREYGEAVIDCGLSTPASTPVAVELAPTAMLAHQDLQLGEDGLERVCADYPPLVRDKLPESERRALEAA